MSDTIQYYIKNKKIKNAELEIPVVVEEFISNKTLDILAIKKLSISSLINNIYPLSFRYNEQINTVKIIITIEGQLEYINIASETKLYNFTLLKTLLLEIQNTNLNTSPFSEIYIYEAICKKVSINEFYISFFANCNLNIL
ncbi:MAG: hypothetical protein ACRCTZ_03420 [Sarcina sp.]